MTYTKLIEGIQQNYPLVPVVVTMGLIEYLQYVERQPDDAIKRIINSRGGDVSKGSTYILDLHHQKSYRFKDHHKLNNISIFRGFFPTKNPLKLLGDLSLDEFKQCGCNWGLSISEVSKDGEVHDSTPIVLVTIISRMMANKTLKHNSLDIIREYERKALGQVRIPNPNHSVPVDIKPFII